MGLTYIERVRFKHYLRNTVNQDVGGGELLTLLMQMLQTMEKDDFKDKQRVLNKISEQNRAAARSTTKLEIVK